MKTISQRIRNDAAIHILIWGLLIIPHGFFSYFVYEKLGIGYYLFNLAASDGLLLAIVYLNINYLIGRFYRTGHYATYFIFLGMGLAFFTFASAQLEMFTNGKLGYHEPMTYSILTNFFNISRYCVIAFLLYSLQEKFDQKKQMDRIKVEKLNTEVNYLRAQINPHFLFNTLNNLYGLALEKSDKTPEVILKLSKVMDFMLYELDGSKVTLRRDVENLENYIEIERIRQGNNAKIVFRKQGVVEHQMVEPLLLLPLVENAFKHGVNQLIEGAYLEIDLEGTEEQIKFRVRNNYKINPDGEEQIHAGIGLSNLRRRLELFYPGKHTLEVNDDSTNYQVHLTVDLT